MEWTFFVPVGATSATLSVLAEGDWGWGKAFALDDIEVRALSPAQILSPAETEISVLFGKTQTLTGSYAVWQFNRSAHFPMAETH
ncbi:MAG: hypothetical protein LUD46_10110 [Parabacteroides sp.]|nr:hypothetical protein [Parabacteroides sp.]